MSHHQSKGDRSDAQLNKAGRASGSSFAREGGFLSIAAKGGGPSPSKRVSAVAAVTPQSASSVSTKARTSTLAAFTNPGGRRANGPPAPGRGPPVGGSSEPGGSNMLRLPVSTQRQSSLQQQDATNALQYPQVGSARQYLDVRKTMEGGLAKSSASSSGCGLLSESKQPITTGSYEGSQSTHVPLSFQFGSFDPSFESFTSGKPLSMLYPLRTNSAPPNIDEQQREQARFERLSPQASAPAHGKQQTQVASSNMGTPVADFSPAMVQHTQANVNSQALGNVPSTAQATPQQLTQGQYTQQHTQAANVHMPAPHLLQLAQMQQAMSQQQQQQPHQAMPQQQGMAQQGLTQAMKYAQPMMAPPPHGPQVLGTHIGSPLANQLSVQQILPQMAHSIGPTNLASGMGGQLSPSMQGSQYGAPSTNQFLPQRVSRAIKIVDPHTHEELRFEVKRGDCLKDNKPTTSGSGTPGQVGRLSTNGAAQRPPAGYNPSPSHQMVPGSMAFYGHPYSHPPPSFFQSVPPKAAAPAGGPPSNTSAVRFNYAGPLPGQVVPFVGHPGAALGSACPKGAPQLGPMPQISSGTPASNLTEVYNKPPMAPMVITPIVVPSGIPPVMANSRPSSIGSCPMPLVGNNHLSILNRRPAGLPASTSAHFAPSLTIPPLAFKFGDLDALDSTLVDAGQSIIEGSLVTTSGQASTSPPILGVLATINMSVTSSPVVNCKPTAASPKRFTSSLSTGAVNLKPPSTVDTGSSGSFNEKVKVETVKTLGIQNSRKNSKKDRQRQQQHQASPHLITPTLQVFEGQSDKISGQLVPSTVLTSMEDLSLDGPSAIAASLQVHRAGLHDAQSGADITVTLHAPSISTSILELPKMKSKVTVMGHETFRGSETPHTEDVGESVGKEERELLAQQIMLADANEPWDLGSSTGHERTSISMSDIFSSSTGSSFSKDKVSKGKECALCQRNVLVHENFIMGTSASSCAGCKCLTDAFEQVEEDLNDFQGKKTIAEEYFSASMQEEQRGEVADCNKEGMDSELNSKLGSTVPSIQLLEAVSALNLKPIEGLVTPDSYLENDEGMDQGALTVLYIDGGGTSDSTVSSPVSLNTEVGPSFKLGHTELSFVKDITVGKTSSGGAEVLEETDEADKRLSENDLASDVIDRVHSAALLDKSSCEVEESAIQVLSLSTDTVEGTPNSREKAVVLSVPPVTQLMAVVSEERQHEFKVLTTPAIADDLFILKSNICLRSLDNLRSTESAPTGCEDVSALSFEESSSEIECAPLSSSPLGEISVAVHMTENGTETLEPTSMGHSNLAMEGLKGASKKKKKKEFLARADAAGNTADLYNAYKAPPEKKLEGVKQIDACGPGLSNSDVKDCVAVPHNSVLKEVDDWEDAAELSTPSVSFAQPLDPGDRKYTRDFLMTFKDQNQHIPLNFEIRHEIIQELLLNPAIYCSGVLDVIPSPGRIGDRQPGSGGPRLDRRGLGVQHGPNEDRWTRQPGLVPSPGRNQLGDVRMDMCVPVGFRPGQTNTQPGLISHLSSPVWPGMVSPQTGFMGLISRGPGSTMLPHFMAPAPSRGNLNGVDGDRWHRQPMVGSGMIPSSRTPLPAIHKAENRYEVGKVSDEESAKQRLIKGILNKLTPQNFEKLFAQVQAASIDSAETLTGVISQIFDKALMEPTFCEMYAQFCVKLAADLPEFTENDEKITFKRVLLNKCQEEFERGEREQEEAEKIENEGEVKLTLEEREEKRLKARRRMLGNIRFIGELYKKSMLTERIMHECIKKLLGEFFNPDEEDVEALCKLMSTIGRIIDHPKAKEHIDAYFRRIEGLSNNMKLSSRLRFMLKDVIDLRQNGWQERRKVEGPKKIDEVHRDAVQERQQAARADRRGPSMGGAPARVRNGPGPEFGMRSAQLPGFSPNQIGAGTALGGMRRAPSPQGAMQGGGGSFVQDVRMEDRSLMDIRSVPLPLSQKATDDSYITLGPQGNLGRVLGIQQPSTGRGALSDISSMACPDVHRSGGGVVRFSVADRPHYGFREDLPMRASTAEQPASAEKLHLDRLKGPDRGGPGGGRDLRITPEQNRIIARLEHPTASVYQFQPQQPEVMPPCPSLLLSDVELKKKCQSTINEYYSVMDLKEAGLCVEELKATQYHPVMVSTWVSESLEKKEKERELLLKLLLHLSKCEPLLLTHEQFYKGMEGVLLHLVDTAVDVPKAPEFLGVLLGGLVSAGVFSLIEVNTLLKDSGAECTEILMEGYSLDIIGAVLDALRKEKGEKLMLTAYRNSGIHVEDFVSPNVESKGVKLDVFLERRNLQALLPMLPLERHIHEALARKDPILDLVKWIERNVPQSTTSDPSFLRMIMTQVLRHSLPNPIPSDFTDKEPMQKMLMSMTITVQTVFLSHKFVLESWDFATDAACGVAQALSVETKTYVPLLRKFASGKARTAEGNQLQYIIAVQLFANEAGHPLGLMSKLFDNFYHDEVISEGAYTKWQDNVQDSTPGRDRAIREVGKWLAWLETAPEELGED